MGIGLDIESRLIATTITKAMSNCEDSGASMRTGGMDIMLRIGRFLFRALWVTTLAAWFGAGPAVYGQSEPRHEEQGQSLLFRSPNMFGDVIGHRPLQATTVGNTVLGQLSGLVRFPNNDSQLFLVTPGSTFVDNPVGPVTYLGANLGVATFNLAAPNPGGPAVVALLPNAQVTQSIQSQIVPGGQIAVFNPASLANIDALDTAEVLLVYDLVNQRVILLPNPADGGLAGRHKVSYDNNPLPRDRVIFTYDYLSNSALSSNLAGINRYTVGFEKTFFDNLCSIEVRLPLASTINPTQIEGQTANSGTGTIGNLFVAGKVLGVITDTYAISAGLGVSIPTAQDVRVRNAAGGDVVVIRNDAVFLTPFVAGLWAPSERLLAQGWVSCNIDAGGNPAFVNPGTGLQSIGRLTQETLMNYDIQLSYWVVQPGETEGIVQGLAPFIEGHINHGVGNSPLITSGVTTLGASRSRGTEVNLSAGATVQLGNDVNLQVGGTIPVGAAQDRFSNWQVGVRLNWFFGNTASLR
jgi:hypothetical protein